MAREKFLITDTIVGLKQVQAKINRLLDHLPTTDKTAIDCGSVAVEMLKDIEEELEEYMEEILLKPVPLTK